MADHHFVPQFYLRGFRDPQVPEGQEPWLWVADFEDGSIARRAPKNVGKRANYYAFPSREHRLDEAAEKLLSQIESAAAPVVRTLREGANDLAGPEWADLLLFAAFFVGRSPFFRNTMEQFTGDVGDMILREAASRPGYFERTFREATKAWDLTPEEVEEIRRLTEQGAFKVKGSLTLSLLAGFEAAEGAIYPVFTKMRWAILRPGGEARFVTCDSPVSWVDPTPRPAFYSGHGLAMRKVEVTFPVGPEVCLLGTWEGPTGAVVVPACAVDEFNRRRTAFADRYAFSHTETLAHAAVEHRQTMKEPEA